MGVLDRLFGRNRRTETPEAKAHRLREEDKRTVLGPNRGGGAKIITSGQVGAAYGVQAIDDRALELIQSGIRARQSGDFKRALSLYRQALALEPRSVDAHNGLAATHVGLGNIDESLKEYRLAIQHSPEHVADGVQVIYVNLANAILKKGVRRLAIDEFQTAAQDLPQSSGYHCALGLAYWKVGDPGKARSEFQEVLRIDPNGTCGQAAREWSGKIDRGEGPG